MNSVVTEIREIGSAKVAVATGEINLDRTPAFHKELISICEGKPEHLIVNLSDVTHIDSAGVGTLVEIFRRIKQNNNRMSLVGLSGRVLSVFEISKLDQFFSIYETEQQALDS